MPRRFKRFHRRRRPIFRSRRRRFQKGRRKVFAPGKASTSIIRQPSGVPDRIFVKLVYSEDLIFNQGSGTLGYNVYRGNSLFDPDLTGTGGQPYFFDQWAAFYQNYRVHGSAIRVIWNATGGTCVAINTMIAPACSSTAMGSSEILQEQPRCKTTTLRMGATGIGQAMQRHYSSTARQMGVKRMTVKTENDYAPLTSASPTSGWYWHIGNYERTGATMALTAQVKLTYFAEFFYRARPGTS